jgi:hypothetical protein
MKYLVICTLILAGALFAGCVDTQEPPAATTTPTTLPVVTTVNATANPQPVFTLGSRYLEDPGGYLLLTGNDTMVKEFRVDSTSWGIFFRVLPLHDNLQYCWFVLDVTDIDRNNTESFGYGREYPSDLEQWIPMYKEGPYRLTMNGNNVKVWVTAAKRIP